MQRIFSQIRTFIVNSTIVHDSCPWVLLVSDIKKVIKGGKSDVYYFESQFWNFLPKLVGFLSRETKEDTEDVLSKF